MQNARVSMDSQQELKTKWITFKININIPLMSISWCAVSCAAPLIPTKQRVVIGSLLARGGTAVAHLHLKLQTLKLPV